MHRPNLRLTAALPLAALAALTLAGCGRSGYGTVNTHQLVLIPTATPTTQAVRRADAALACAVRAEAQHLHHALKIERPRTGSASSQIAVANAVTADKPGGVLIVPVARNAMLAPILSMRRAGIKVARLSAPHEPRTAAAEGARAAAWAVGAIEGRNRDMAGSGTVSLLDRCTSVH